MKTAASGRTPRPLPLFTAHALPHPPQSRTEKPHAAHPPPPQVSATGSLCHRLQTGLEVGHYLRARPGQGSALCLRLFPDLHDRCSAGRERQREESAEHAAQLSAPSAWTTAAFARSLWSCIQTTGGETPLRAQVPRGPAAALMLAALVDLGITASCSPPRVSHDHPGCESSLRTFKTRHDYPALGKDREEQARSCIAAAVSWINPQHRPPKPQLRHSQAAAPG